MSLASPWTDGQLQDVADQTVAKALTECMTVLPEEGRAEAVPGYYTVIGESGASEYLVDRESESCTCPDARHRDRRCKHYWRAMFATGAAEPPRWADRDAIDDQLGEHTDGDVRLEGDEDV